MEMSTGLTREMFAEAYARRSGTTVDSLRERGREARPCDCDYEGCEGWQMAYIGEISNDSVPAQHPEATCQRCGRPNVWSWFAPSPLWNAVMRDPETGDDAWSIVCPPCFAELAEDKGLGGSAIDGKPRWTWRFAPADVDVSTL